MTQDNRRASERGSVIAPVIVALALGAIGVTVVFNTTSTMLRTQNEMTKSGRTYANVEQALRVLAQETADPDTDSVEESIHEGSLLDPSDPSFSETPPPLPALGTAADVGYIPGSSGAPKVDGYGTPIASCVWDWSDPSGPPSGDGSETMVAVVSAGKDKIFQTSCADLAAGGGGAQVDDLAYSATVTEVDTEDVLNSVDANTSGGCAADEALNWDGSNWSCVGDSTNPISNADSWTTPRDFDWTITGDVAGTVTENTGDVDGSENESWTIDIQENDPGIDDGSLSVGDVPRWNGSALAPGLITDNGTDTVTVAGDVNVSSGVAFSTYPGEDRLAFADTSNDPDADTTLTSSSDVNIIQDTDGTGSYTIRFGKDGTDEAGMQTLTEIRDDGNLYTVGQFLTQDGVVGHPSLGKTNYNAVGSRVFTTSPADIVLSLDSDSNGTGASFDIRHHAATPTGGNRLFRVREDGVVQVTSLIEHDGKYENRLYLDDSKNAASTTTLSSAADVSISIDGDGDTTGVAEFTVERDAVQQGDGTVLLRVNEDGDVSSPQGDFLDVDNIRGTDVDDALAPTDGQFLIWDNSAGHWEAQTISFGNSGDGNNAGDTDDFFVDESGDTMDGDLVMGGGGSPVIAFGGGDRQMIDLYGATHGIGAESNTTYFRSPGNFGWYVGGSHSATNLDAGAGTVAMTLSSTGALTTNAGALLLNQNWEATSSYGGVTYGGVGNTASIEVDDGQSIDLLTVDHDGADGGTVALRVSGHLDASGGYFRSNVGIGVTDPQYDLDAGGTVRASSFISTSDRRLKTDIEEIDRSLERIAKIEGVRYRWKDEAERGSGVKAGLIAQDVERALPEAALKSGDGEMSVDFNAVTGLLVGAVKDLDERSAETNAAQQATLRDLRRQVEALRDRVETLEDVR